MGPPADSSRPWSPWRGDDQAIGALVGTNDTRPPRCAAPPCRRWIRLVDDHAVERQRPENAFAAAHHARLHQRAHVLLYSPCSMAVSEVP